MATVDFSEFFLSIEQPNPYLSRLKMGQVYYLVIIISNTFLVRKVMLMNFPNSTRQNTTLKLMRVAKEDKGTEYDRTFSLDVEVSIIPTRGQRRDTIYTSRWIVFCKSKQAALDVIKSHTFKAITTLKDRFSPYNTVVEREYIKAIEKLKSL
jgi:hypothetical protein